MLKQIDWPLLLSQYACCFGLMFLLAWLNVQHAWLISYVGLFIPLAVKFLVRLVKVMYETDNHD